MYAFASILMIAAAASTGAARPLPISEARKISETGARYEIEGDVVSVSRYWSAIRDESGAMRVRNWTKPWNVGDVVRTTIEMDEPHDDNPGYVRQIARHAMVLERRPPRPVREVFADDVSKGRISPFACVALRGTVTSVFPDEIDGAWSFIVVEGKGEQTVVSLNWANSSNRVDLADLVDAEVVVNGIFNDQASGGRQYMGRNIQIDGTNAISIVRAAPSDPFEASPFLNLAWPTDSNDTDDGHRRRAVGTVVARWMGRTFMLKTDDGRPITVKLAPERFLPPVGAQVETVGFVRRTPFVMKLSNALWRRTAGRATDEPPVEVDAPMLLSDKHGEPIVNIRFHGRLIRIKGIVTDVLAKGSTGQILSLNCDGKPFLAVAEGVTPPAIGSIVEATGICIANENQDADDLTRLSGLSIILRGDADLKTLKTPPWWTAGRLLVVIGILFALIAAIALWVWWLNRVVEQRSRELHREQKAHEDSVMRIGERTRLAVELHDSLSQSLAALSFQISSARTAKAEGLGAAEEKHLVTAEKMLDSSRAELRHCLLDLRSDMLEERDFSKAILKALRADAADTGIEIDFRVRRSQMNDSTAHAILMIIRELVSNAIRHGRAKKIQITGEHRENMLVFSVVDDGLGFDVDNYPGLHEGHFGLAGVRQRVINLGGRFTLRSAKGEGSAATVSIKFNDHEGGQAAP